MSYLSFLCARLLDLRNETRAARVIQGAWRKYRLKKDVELYKVCSPPWPTSNKHIFITFFFQKYVRFFKFILQLCDANFVSDLAVALVSGVKKNLNLPNLTYKVKNCFFFFFNFEGDIKKTTLLLLLCACRKETPLLPKSSCL